MKNFILVWLLLTASIFAQSKSVRFNTTTKALIEPTATEFRTANSIQPLDADLTSIAGLTTTAFGRGLLDDANAAAALATIGAEPALGNPATNGFALVSTTGGLRTWAAVGGIPGGSTTELQFNDAGALGGVPGLTWNGSLLTLPGVWAAPGARIVATAAMSPAHQINVALANQTDAITSDATLTLSATPAAGTWFGFCLSDNGTGPRTITLPAGTWFSEAFGGNRTTFTIGASQHLTCTVWFDGTVYHIFGDPVRILDLTVATVAPGADWIEFYDATDGLHKRTLTADLFPHSTLTYAASTALDFLGDSFRTVTLTGDITFTTSNRMAGRSLTIRIVGDGSVRTFTFPAWKFVGAAAPASLAANKIAILTITAFGTADTDIVAAYSAEP